MLGRAVCNRPALLGELENRLLDPRWRVPAPVEVIEQVVPYARRQIAAGARLHSISRHLHGLLAGVNGARAWRRFLSDVAAKTDATADTLYGASAILRQAAA
jgi:tRNA-dihydrouridine synthase A